MGQMICDLPEGIEFDQALEVYSVRLPENGQLLTYAYLASIDMRYWGVPSHAPINYALARDAIRLRDAVRDHLARRQ
jgi:hypothetical protein